MLSAEPVNYICALTDLIQNDITSPTESGLLINDSEYKKGLYTALNDVCVKKTWSLTTFKDKATQK